MAIVSKADLNFQNALSVIPATQSFILPIPALKNGGDEFVFPIGDKRKGLPLTGSDGEVISGRGIVFLNSKDKSWQAVKGDGSGVVVINNVSLEQAKALQKKVMQLSNNEPQNLDKDKIKLFLKYAHALGLKDVVHADRNFVSTQMRAVEVWETGVENFGFYTYNKDKSSQAIRFSGSVAFNDTNLSKHSFENGCVVVRDSSDALTVIKPEVFLKSYTKPNGSPVTLFDVPMKLTTKQYSGIMNQRSATA